MTSFLVSHAIYAIIVFGVLEAMCIPISSELTFLLGGAIASGAVTGAHQHPSLALVIILGTLAELTGSYISYAVGRVGGGRPLVHRWGRYVLITEADVARAERFLVGRGVWAVPVARMLPFVRAFASIVAGIVEIPPLRFGVLSLIGTFVYVVVLSSIGYSLGSEWSGVVQPRAHRCHVRSRGRRRRGDHRVRVLPAARVQEGKRGRCRRARRSPGYRQADHAAQPRAGWPGQAALAAVRALGLQPEVGELVDSAVGQAAV